MQPRANGESRLGRVATLVDHLASGLQADRLTRAEANAARAQIGEMVSLLATRRGGDARALASALRRLSNRLGQVDSRRRPRQADKARNRRLLRALRRIALIVTAGAAVSAPLAAAAAPVPSAPPAALLAIPVFNVGDLVFNPATELNEKVVEVISPAVVRTDLGNFILLAQTVGDTFIDPETGESYEVTVVTLNGAGNPVTVTVEDTAGDPFVLGVVTDKSGEVAGVVPDPDGPDGSGSGDFTFTPAAGDINTYADAQRGDDGGGGSHGGGVRICVPLLGCATIGKHPSSGGEGAGGPTVNVTVDSSWGDIESVSDGLPGIVASSVGGNGGDGGNGYGVDIPGASGGRAGQGGAVTVNASVAVTTSGEEAHGIFAQSRSGRGGDGGSGYIASGGGGGGTPGQGGAVHVTHSGQIATSGDGAMGVLAQSLGGAAGGGGDSYGIIGDGGGGTSGGNGGTVTVDHSGSIVTTGADAHGILAQSIGGSGGNAGDSGGIVTFGDDGEAGGDGGQATIYARTGSSTSTSGEGSHALFAQSVGGGGGNGGNAGALVTLGSGGGSGGAGGLARIFLEAGSAATTTGDYSHAVFAQSVGGGGGDSGVSGGAVTLGASGDAGGAGGAVEVTSAGDVSTSGLDARGVFAQSVGGGGGAARGTGGAVSLGGGGAGGGAGGNVTVVIQADGSVTTSGDGADGVFAQSVGGGGGSGSSSGGVVALGGTGGGGGSGGVVSVTNEGLIQTQGATARGIFAQSVGGGGGSGGDGGGLATIGGAGGGLSTGGNVTVTNSGSISTAGNLSSAIQAQSIGGGGGDGGSTGGVFLTIGGEGGGGGASGLVTVNHSGDLFTAGDDSHGIFAQAVGGGGGNGGSSTSISAFAGVAIGGDGGGGGDGGTVDVNLTQSLVNVGGSAQYVDPLIVTSGDRARGLFIQSVGGGGGNGGYASQVSAGYGAAVSVSLGGSGGDGGVGGAVTLDGDATIATSGDYAEGLFAQSVGGGGGNGGFALSFAFAGGETAAGALSVGIGGSGGSGGVGGLVTVDSGGAIATSGDFSTGLITQSVGGGGGNGGFSISFAGSAAGAASASAAVGVGGSGGSGGAGGTVNTTFDGSIATLGDDAGGALIQSVGGGGGNGGFNVSGAVSIAGAGGGAGAVGVGGSGGDGGDGGEVVGHVGGPVQTAGDRSTGVTVQSMGGGGGNGGFNVSGSIGGGGTFGGALSIGVGGSGGLGGDGGAATGSAGDSIFTSGNQSGGLMVQSVGGGGGNGGFNVSGSIGGGGTVGAGVSIGVGGAGGGGGDGGAARGDALGPVWTTGDQSAGVTVQSLGGGGGNGAFNVSGGISGGGTVGGALSVGVGGAGGGGGDGDTVDATAGAILTEGDQSRGFLAQSVGGGGGSGGFSVSGSIGGASTVGAGVSVGVGGAGGGGGDGDRVTATVAGDVTTLGDGSDAITAQSIGGGGGSGGFAVAGSISGAATAAGSVSVGVGGSGGVGGDSGAVTLEITGETGTAGADSDAILAQSVGGGGGSGGFSVAGGIAVSGAGAGTIGIAVGGQGGGGGNAGDVILRVNDGVADPDDDLLAAATLGDGSSAVVAQSLGGGGGNGGFSVSGGVAAAKDGAGNIGVGVGGGGGDGGDSASVVGEITGDVMTAGHDASAVLVQSVGGGGGNGGFNITGGVAGSKSVAGNLMVGVGGFGGGGGDAGNVSGGVSGDISTQGDRSFGVSYQSLGGGGGNGGFNITGGISLAIASGGGAGNVGVGVGGFGGDGGDSGDVEARLIGDISTLGVQAHGALLQSVGGGGGTGGFNVTGGISASNGVSGTLGFGLGGFGGGGGDAGSVIGVLTGDVTTAGDESFGALLQSLGGGGGNGGLNVTGALSLTANNNASVAAGIGVGGFAGGGGDASDVTGTVTGQYVTSGTDADGVTAQSLGGGGGSGGLNVSGGVALGMGTSGTAVIGIGGFGGDGGDSGAVNLVRVGDTFTQGADSNGVVGQSVAGGGGSGGVNVSGGVSGSINGSAGSFGLGLGGFGGAGGDAGAVDVHVTGNVIASGLGDDVRSDESTIEVEVGTEIVEVVIPASRTRLNGSHGVVAQSVGGGGGSGGVNVTGSISLNKPGGGSMASRAVSIGIGGFGGAGGDAGDVDLTIMAPGADRVQVSAVGDGSVAAMAQSVGGGGGAGGVNVSGSITMDGQLTAGVGGFGGGGGLGRDVTAAIDADLFASGNGSRGLSAQSIGGGGGSGGINISGGLQTDKAGDEPSLVFGIGGFGGSGNASGDVAVAQNGLIMVEGVESIGVLAQSVAGGGGSGGLNVSAAITTAGSTSKVKGYGIGVGVGGSGGDGADAGDVLLNSTGDILINAQLKTDPAAGEDILESVEFTGGSTGILAQSIGGGGGVGGVNATGVVAPFGNPVAIGVGGSGGSGGHGGTVAVTRGYLNPGPGETEAAGLIRTFGDNSDGLVAQSIGGGGGMAGMNFTFAATIKPQGDSAQAAIISVGGSGAGAGSGDTVDVRHFGNIVTDGDGSDALVAQSIGGGGGDANFNVGLGLLKNATALNLAVGGATGAGGTGGDVTVEHQGTILTGGDNSAGIRAQSIGGGGGNTALSMATGLLARNALNISVGRLGGAGGAAGDVSVTADGVIDTTGANSHAIFAQSIGGGGGASGATSVGGQVTSGTGSQARTYNGNVAVGLEGGVGASGGDVTVDLDGAVTTRGDEARGVFAQSIGGGGGTGGAATNIIFGSTGAATVGVGGTGGVGAVSGVVTVASDATIVTEGDKADGILAQSIGGGGGLGGYAATAALQASGTPSGDTSRTASVNVGGSGGTGAHGNTVDVVNTGIISTEGVESFGIRAQSIGGGGGVGGATINVRAQAAQRSNDSVEVNIGGSGGDGGYGGSVNVLNEGLIVTRGVNAAGISANSIGGGGGDAGILLDVVGGYTGSAAQSHRFVLNIGGDGGVGGAGGDVSVTNRDTGAEYSGEIVTLGDGAYGILAQSLGGGGGNGSSVISLTALVTGKNSATAGLTIGGSGGSGNTGGTVDVLNEGLIDTSGAGAHGILAQSIGGGGGNGGMAIAANILINSPTNAPLVSIGGTGGDGGDGGDVTVTNSGDIVTRGALSHGVVAQSIGGGGGNAQMGFGLTGEVGTLIASNTIAALVGATGGGTGGTGGSVTVNHTGDITVLGDGSLGIKAESINGGGGTLTLNFDGIAGLPGVPFIGANGEPERPDPILFARAGADGANSMNAGSVTVNSTGTFGAAGDNGVGAFYQSIGGGGGTIDLNVLLSTDLLELDEAPAPIRVDIDLGGVDGQNNNGGDIISTHSGMIVTEGRNTSGSLIQSIGGGGGRAVVDITVPAGGAPLGPIDILFGGENGQDEAGGDIDRVHSGGLFSLGDLSAGAILQSIGGGGGSASVVLHDGASSPASAVTPSAIMPEAAIAAAPVLAAFGANGGSGLNGGAVNAVFSGDIVTQGDIASGLIVQSIGAGGGEVRLSGAGAPDVTFGGLNGASGAAGNITLVNTGQIVTTGVRSHGVFMQSIGGGGGAVFGDFAAPTVALNADNIGDGGAIVFSQSGDIVALGAGSYGVIAQSLGGGGGWVDGAFAGTAGGAGQGGSIQLDIDGQVFAAGDDGVGIFAQSLGASGGGDITLVSSGLIRGGAGTGAGVVFDGGDQNLIQTNASISAVSGWAIRAGDGDERVENDGLVVGNLDLGGGDNAFVNGADATFVAFNTIDLRDQPAAQGEFINDGVFLMGLDAPAFPLDLAAGDVFGDFDDSGDPATNLMYGARVINTVELDGDFVQTASGHLAFDVAFGPYASDRVNVTGDATVAGTGDITLTWLENAEAVTLFATGGVGVDNGLEISDTIALDYSIRGDAAGVHLSFVSDFGQDFLNDNGQALGGSIDDALLAGGSGGIGRLAALLGNLSTGQEDIYSAIFTELDPQPHIAPLQLQFAGANSFSNELFGCTNVVAQTGDQCVWVQVARTSRDSDADVEHFGVTSHGARLRAGFEQPARGRWTVAAAVGYDDIEHMRIDGLRAFSDGQALNLGLGLRRTAPDGFEAGMSLSGGWQWIDTQRSMNIFGPAIGVSSPENRYIQLSGHVAQLARHGAFFVKPALNASVTALHGGGFAEQGLGGQGVERLADTQYVATLNPEMQMGVVFADTPGAQGVLSFTVGGLFHSEDRIESPFRLVGANPASDPAVIGAALDRQALRFGADFSIAADNGVSLRLRYSGEFGDRTDSHSAGADLRFRF